MFFLVTFLQSLYNNYETLWCIHVLLLPELSEGIGKFRHSFDSRRQPVSYLLERPDVEEYGEHVVKSACTVVSSHGGL